MTKCYVSICGEIVDWNYSNAIAKLLRLIFNSEDMNVTDLSFDCSSLQGLENFFLNTMSFQRAQVYLYINPKEPCSEFLQYQIEKRNPDAQCYVLVQESEKLQIPKNFEFKNILLSKEGITKLISDLVKITGLSTRHLDYQKFIDDYGIDKVIKNHR